MSPRAFGRIADLTRARSGARWESRPLRGTLYIAKCGERSSAPEAAHGSDLAPDGVGAAVILPGHTREEDREVREADADRIALTRTEFDDW